MSAEFEARTRIGDFEEELREISAVGLVVVPERGQERGRSPHAVLPVVLVVALIVAACSGPAARAGESPTVPEVTATEAAAIPGMQEQVRIPAIGSEVTPGPTAEAAPVAPKPLPEVISSDTLKEANRGTVIPNAEQRESERASSIEKGSYVIPLPNVIFELGGKVQTTSKKDGFVFTDVDQNIEVSFPALIEGRVVKAGKMDNHRNWIRVQGKDGNKVNVLFPIEGLILVKEGEQVSGGQVVLKTKYSPDFDNSFPSYVPKKALVAVSVSDSGDRILPIDQNNVQTDSSGRVVAIAASGKG